MRRKLWIAAAVLVVLVVAALLALPRLVDANRYRGLIQERASAALGRDVRLGELRLSLLPVFGVRVDDVAVAALPEEGGGELLTAASLRVGARLLPLLRKRLEVTSIVVQRPRIALVRGADGQWNVQRLLGDDGGRPQAESAGSAPTLRVDRLRLSDAEVVIRDQSGARPLEVTLAALDLSLERWPAMEASALDLSARLEAEGGSGALTARGRLGPSAAAGSLPLDLAIQAPRLPLALLRPFLGEDSGLEPGRGTLALDVKLAGDLPRRFKATGTLGLTGAAVRFTGPHSRTQGPSLDLRARYDVEIRDAGAALEARELTIDLGGNRLSLRGTARREGTLQRVDVELQPASLPAADLAALLTLVAGELPVAFSSGEPVELRGRAWGLVGQGRLPEVEGAATLRDFTFRHPAMKQPLEQVRANVTLRGETVEIEGLAGRIGSSDLEGRLTLAGFAAPALGFDLHSRRADLGELFSFLEQGETPQGSSPAGEPTEPTLDGVLRIDQGTFETLDFADLEATMQWRDGVVTLDPLGMALYAGQFSGRVVGDLRGAEPLWDVSGEIADVDVGAFLADNADAPGVLSGRFTGQVGTEVRGSDYEAIVRGLNGKGTARVQEGRVGRLDVLKTLSGVSGVFGETTLQRLSQQLASEGTDFQHLSSDVGLAGGRMNLEKTVLESPAFRLTGRGALDLLSTEFRGEFRLILSPEISQSMRAEKSRAADLFWNSRTGQVELPFSLAGPFATPTPSVDFQSIARDAIKGRAQDKLAELAAEKLGLGRSQPPAPAPATPVPPPATATGELEPTPVEPASTLAAEITGARWSGAVLARDLRIEGLVRGAAIDHARLVVADARGTELRRIDRLEEVRAHLEAAADPAAPATVRVAAKIDGKKLALARFPLHVTLIVVGADGATEEATLDVEH